MHRLSGYNLCDVEDFRISYLFDFLSRYKEGVDESVENLSFNELVNADCGQRLED